MAKKKRKKKNHFKKFLSLLIIFIIIGVVGVLGYKSYQELNSLKEDLSTYTFNPPDIKDDKLELPITINDQIKIEWNSSNQEVIKNDGTIIRPDFEAGDTTVTLTGTLKFSFKELLSATLFDIFVPNIENIVFDVPVMAKVAKPIDKIQNVYDRLSLIEQTYDSIILPTQACYEDIVITWDSDRPDIMDYTGQVNRPDTDTIVTLKATIKCQDVSLDKEFKLAVLCEEQLINVVDDHFDNQASTSTYKQIVSTNNVTYNNARIIAQEEIKESEDLNATTPSIIRLRNKEDSNGAQENDSNIGCFVINDIMNPKSFAFDYQFSGSQSSKGSKLYIYITDLLNNKIDKKEIEVIHQDTFITLDFDLSMYQSVSIKVEHIDTWKTDTYIDIDNVIVNTKVSIELVKEWVINNTPSNVSNSFILPFTTIYGGSIVWESSSSNLTSYGYVNKTEETQKIILSGTVTYLDSSSNITIEVTINGKTTKEALEVYFIDIGKYGAGDCGESIYIKYGNIDIVVDAGDNFTDSKKAINEVINKHLQDGIIDYVIATHPDGDHIGGMASLFETYTIKNLIKFEGTYHTKKYQNMEQAYLEEKCNVYQIQSDIIDLNKQDKFIELSSDIYISFVDTTYYDNSESNGKSIVFTITAYGKKVLMTGDADNASGHTDLEMQYMHNVGDVDILKVVHHGTANGTSKAFLEAVDPEVAIICNGNYLGNKHGHPTPTAINNLYSYDSEMLVYAICGGGTVDGIVDTKNITYKCSSEDRFNQRNGTISLFIDNNGYRLESEYYSNNMIELKNTNYYQKIEQSNLFSYIK